MPNLARVTMPQLGESVTEGTIGAWLKKPGDTVEKYESLAEVITDKVNAEIPSPYAGVIKEIIGPENEALPVGTLIATIETESELEEAAAPSTPAPAPAAAPTPTPAPAPVPVAAAPAQAPAPVTATAAAPRSNGTGRSNGATATSGRRLPPAVARLIEEHDLDASQIPATGPDGRLRMSDVEAYIEGIRNGTITAPAPAAPAYEAPAAAAPAAYAAPAPADYAPYNPAPAAPAYTPAPAPSAPIFQGAGDQVVPLTGIRRSIADHMVRSVHTSPHAWSMVEVDMSSIWNYRSKIKAGFAAREGVEPSLVAFVLVEAMKAIRQQPYVNAVWSDQGIVVKQQINAGIAVDLGDQGLIVPVIQNADSMSVTGLARLIPDLANRARANKLKLEELQGSTFTLNNSGSFGSVLSMPILNQPNVINLTMEAIVKRPVVINDAIAIRPMMNMCCSFDHRVVDGATAGRFLQAVKKNIEAFSGEGLGL